MLLFFSSNELYCVEDNWNNKDELIYLLGIFTVCTKYGLIWFTPTWSIRSMCVCLFTGFFSQVKILSVGILINKQTYVEPIRQVWCKADLIVVNILFFLLNPLKFK